MATKERAGEKLLRFPRRDTVNVSRRAFLGLAEAGVGFLLGAVLAGAELFGLYAPFGVAAVAAAGSGVSGFCTLAGTCLGYLCLEGLTDGMRYAASAILVYAVAFAFFDTKAYRTAWFMPAIASLLCALTGIICRGGDGWHGEDLIYFVTEVLCAGGAALAYRVLFLQWPETLDGLRDLPPKETAGVLVLGGTVLMSLARVELLGTFSLGRLLAAVGVMWAARRGPWGGILAGAAAGVALDLSSGKDPYYSLVFAMAGLACGFCRNQRKILTALVYLMACLAAVLWSRAGLDYLGLPIEAGVGAVLFLLLPGKKKTEEETEETAALPQGIAAPETDTSRETLARRLDEMAGAFHTLYDSVKDTLHPEDNNTENPAELFTRTADRVCVKCVLRSNCWQRDYEDTKRALNDATPPMMERGRALSTDFNGIFQSRCVHFPEFLGEVNRQLTAFLRRRQARRRTRAARAALCSQYARLDRFLQGGGGGSFHRPDPRSAPAGKTGRLLKKHEPDRRGSVLRPGGPAAGGDPRHRRAGLPVGPAGAGRDLGHAPAGGAGAKRALALCPVGAVSGHRLPGRGAPAGGGSQRRHGHLVPPGGRDALPAPVRRHGLRGRGQARERPGGEAGGEFPAGRHGTGGGGGDRQLRPGPAGRGRRQHHH